MGYADERLPFPARQLARNRQYSSDLNGLISAYEKLEKQREQDAAELESLRAELRDLNGGSLQLRSDLQGARAEIARLRATLAKLRRSPTLRVGKAVMAPARGIRKAARELRSLHGPAVSPAGQPGRPAAPSQHVPAGPAPASRAADRADNQAFLATARSRPSAATIMRAVAHSHFVMGDIREPAELIRRNTECLKSLDRADRTIVDTVLGLDRLLQDSPAVPPRQPNTGYLPERGRVMYCAHSTGHFNSNGYSTRTAELTRGLREQGLEVLVAARPGYPWDVPTDHAAPAAERFATSILGVDHIFTPGPDWTQQPLDRYWLEATDIFVREAQRARVSAIHSASNHVTGLPALAAARRLGIPFSYEVRGLWEVTEASAKTSWEESERYRLAVQLESFVAANADIVFAITEQVRDELVRRGVEPGRIRILPNGVDTGTFTPMPPSPALRNRLNLPDGVPVVGYAGSLVHYEGLSDLLEALHLLRTEAVDFRAVIVGEGPELAALHKQAEHLGLAGQVQFTGRVEAADIPAYMSLFDVMPCPRTSLPVTELVSPLKPLEAMAAGKALILTDLAPLRVFAGQDQERALLALPGDPESLARSLRTLLGKPALRQEMGARARLWAVRYRQWALIGQTAGRELRDAVARAAAEAPAGRPLKDLAIGIIADTFTTEGLRAEADLCEIRPATWRRQMEETPLDVLFVESAWEGIDGLWRQKVGDYDDGRLHTLRDVLAFCQEQGIPTIFWNKEDPVHFNRFRRTAALFDHVFTTDADCIPGYAASSGTRPGTIASLPFYAQPRIHNPLPAGVGYSHTVAYAGSFYGARYPERSAELRSLLQAGRPYGLRIYDRQYLNPGTTYTFPPELQEFVQEGLPYLEMVKAYAAHPVHINVNSVEDSPTMFSRRVAELAASGTAVVSGRGKGVEQVMAGLVQVVSGSAEAEVLLERWMTDERARLHDSWLAYRLIHRGHTAAHRLAYALRCAGLVVRAPEPARYAVRVESLTPELLRRLEEQTVRPAAVICRRLPDGIDSPLRIISENEAHPAALAALGIEWAGTAAAPDLERTLFEDLLTGASFGDWADIGISGDNPDTPGSGLVRTGTPGPGTPRLQSLTRQDANAGNSIVFRRAPDAGTRQGPPPAAAVRTPRRVLVAGHDLKFAEAIIGALKAEGHTVTVDLWQGHNEHDEGRSRALLEAADVVFCEWTMGNASWYSRHVHAGQRLVTRLHSQELLTGHLKNLRTARVDKVIFVGQHTADQAVRDHGIPAEKVLVLPNPVDTVALARSKDDGARFRIGMVGMVPAQKHLGRALDLLAGLRSHDTRYQLYIKGKRPEEYPWMAARPEELAYYDAQYRRIAEDPLLSGAVQFDPHGPDMPQWYSKIGVILSVSDFESFHLALADGAASGALAACLAWPGADRIYPVSWIQASVAEMVSYVLAGTAEPRVWRNLGAEARTAMARKYEAGRIIPEIVKAILGDETAEHDA